MYKSFELVLYTNCIYIQVLCTSCIYVLVLCTSCMYYLYVLCIFVFASYM